MSRPAKRDDGWPTRADIMHDTDAERLCRITLRLVEGMGASTSLTNAVMALEAARHHIADHVEDRADQPEQDEPLSPVAVDPISPEDGKQ